MELRHGDAQAGGTGFAMQACVPSGARTPSVSFAIFAPTYPEGIGLQNQGLQVRVLLGSSNFAAEASTTCNTRGGTRTRNLLLRREAPYPLGHTSRRNLLLLKRIV